MTAAQWSAGSRAGTRGEASATTEIGAALGRCVSLPGETAILTTCSTWRLWCLFGYYLFPSRDYHLLPKRELRRSLQVLGTTYAGPLQLREPGDDVTSDLDGRRSFGARCQG